MKKRIISLIICFGILMQLAVIPAYAKSDNSDKYNILCSLGFFKEDVVYKKDASVQKIELLNAIFSAIPEYKQLPCGNNTGFSDVAATDINANVAYNTYLRGLLGSATKLNPYETIDLETASEIIVNLLGYGASTWNKGYSAIAADLGLTKNMPKTSGFTAENMVNMLYQALDVEIMTPVDSSKKNYTPAKGKTFLTEILCAGRGSGIVNANAYTGIFGHSKVAKGEVMIGEEVFYIDEKREEELLGCKIDYYYKLQENDYAKIVYAKLDKHVEITEFDCENLESYRDYTYEYSYGAEMEKTKKAYFDQNSSIIYNGVEIEAPFDKFQPEYGTIKLISNNGGKINDVVVITDYKIIVSDGYNFDKGIIYNMYEPEKPIEIDKYSEPSGYKINFPDGSPAKISDIEAYDVLFIAVSQNEEKMSIVLSKDTVSGTASSVSELKIVINGTTYDVADVNYLAREGVKSSTSGIFHLDPKGRVVSYEKMKAITQKSGYLTKMTLIPGDEMELEYDVIKVKFFSEDGEMETLYTGKNLYLNDTKVDGASVAYDAFTTVNNDGSVSVVPQLFLYKTNINGEISRIYNARPYDDTSITNKDGFCELSSDKEWLVTNYQRFQLQYRMTDDTIIFAIPKDVTNESGFSVYKKTNPFGWRKYAYFKAYAMETNSAVATHLVWYRGDSGSSGGTPLAIDTISNTIDEDDAPIKIINGITSSGEKSYVMNADLTEAAEDLSSGDVISVITGDEGEITDYTKLFDYGDQKQLIETSSDRRAEPRYGYWNIYSVDGYDMMVTKKAPGDAIRRSETEFLFMSGMPLYKYSKNKKGFEKVDIKDITGFDKSANYSKAFSITNGGDMGFCIFYDAQ